MQTDLRKPVTLSEAIDAYVRVEYPAKYFDRVSDELRHVLSEGDRIERPWVQAALAYLRLHAPSAFTETV